MNAENGANETWIKIKSYITQSAKEVLGSRRVNMNGKRNKKPWFAEERKEFAKKK